MDGRGWIARHGFRTRPALPARGPGQAPPDPRALLWPPAGVGAQAVLRFGASVGAFVAREEAMAAFGSLVLVAPSGLPLSSPRLVGRGRLPRSGSAGLPPPLASRLPAAGLGALTIPATTFAGLRGPVAVAVWTVLLSLAVARAAQLTAAGDGPAAQQAVS